MRFVDEDFWDEVDAEYDFDTRWVGQIGVFSPEDDIEWVSNPPNT